MKRLLLFLFLMLALVGCFSAKSQTQKAIQYGEALEEAIKDFEDEKSQAISEVKSSTEKTVEELKAEKPNLRKAAESWEADWKDLSSKIDDLDKRLLTISRKSREFFTSLERTASGIQDDGALREEELARNKALRASWRNAFRHASQELRDLREVRLKARNVEKRLLLSLARKEIEASIGDLENIASEAQEVLVHLESLSEEGKVLAGGEDPGGEDDPRFAFNEK